MTSRACTACRGQTGTLALLGRAGEAGDDGAGGPIVPPPGCPPHPSRNRGCSAQLIRAVDVHQLLRCDVQRPCGGALKLTFAFGLARRIAA